MTMKAGAKKEAVIAAGEFKAKCLAILDDVESHGRTVVITKRGRPVARVVPLSRPGGMQGTVLFEGDLLSPIDADWDALR
jgi:prevent-host-death family protein